MSRIETFEATGCCTISSVMVSDEAVKWDTSAEWAKRNGVDIQRYSPARNLQQSLNSPVIKEFLNTSGMDSLPVALPDGRPVIAGKLPTRGGIARWADIPFSQGWSEDSTQPRCRSIPRMP